MTPEHVTALVMALGGVTIIPKIIDGIKASRSGKARREKAEHRSNLGRILEAEDRADEEASFRRVIEEWASGLVYMLKQLGVPSEHIPAKPQRARSVKL